MGQDIRPRIPIELKEEVENVHHAATGEEPDSVEDAITTTVTLAYEAIDEGLVDEVIDKKILPEDWQANGFNEEHIQILDEELPETWKQSRLVATRIQHVVYHYLRVIEGQRPLGVSTPRDSEEDEITTHAALKQAIHNTRLEENQELSESAIRTTCYARLYSGTNKPYAAQFKEALENIHDRISESGLGIPERNNKKEGEPA